jgi:GGDEF domain-containing protein
MTRNWWIILTTVFLGAFQAQAATVQCEHFWIQQLPSGNTKFVPSNKPVGIDPGPSPFGTDGVYRCHADFSSIKEGQEGYLYIGEVGDASDLIFERNAHEAGANVIQVSHGIDPDGIEPVSYLRFLPFVVPASRFFKGLGGYEFSVFYKDIVPGQTGIRSGPPAILNGKELASRIFKDFKGELFYLLQLLTAMSLLPFIFLSRKISPFRALALSTLSILTASLFFSFTAIPRNLLNPIFAVRAHDFLLVVVTILGNCSVLLFYKMRFPKKSRKELLIFSGTMTLLLSVLCTPSFPVEGLIKGQALAMLLGGSLLPLYIFFEIYRGNIASRVDLDLKGSAVLTVLVFKASVMGWDAVNLGFMDGRYGFYTGKIYFLPSLLLLLYLEFKSAQSELRFRRNLSLTRGELMKTLSTSSVEDSFVLTSFAEHVARLCHSEKVSISEILPDGKIRLVGKFGNYTDADRALYLDEKSLSALALDKLEIQMASLPKILPDHQLSTELSEYVIVPLRNSEEYPGLLCMTNFDRGIFPPFISERIQLLQAECEVLFHLMKSKRDNRAKARLLQTTRLKVHPLQVESESWFLESFQISGKYAEPAFIYGDVVDSVSINELFGGETLRKVIDAQLSAIFSSNRELGVILSRDRGDSVSLVIPNQSDDLSENDATARAFKVLNSIRDLSDRFAEISKSNGISIPLRYRFVLSVGKIALQDKHENTDGAGLTSFSLLADSAIDEAARIVSNVCLPGEYLLTEHAFRKAGSIEQEVIELPSNRLKGKTSSSLVYCLAKAKNSKRAA